MSRARQTPPAALLLVNPIQPQWLDALGHTSEPAAPGATVRVLADVVEETHVQLDVPALMGSDRQGYVQTRLQALLPDVPLRALWERASAQPILPRPFRLHAVGLSSPLLAEQLQVLAQEGYSVEGVWPLSYLLAQWAGQQAALRTQASLLLCLPLQHGMRMLLLMRGVPVFSRLLLEHEPRSQAREVGLTLKYLADNRVTDRAQPPQVVPLQPAPELLQGLRELGLDLLTDAPAPQGRDVLGEVLALTGGRARGQLAQAPLRRRHLAARLRRRLHLATAALALVGLALLGLQGRALLLAHDASTLERGQAARMHADAAALREQLAQRQINVGLLRLAMQVQEQELQGRIDPAQALWQLGGMLQAQPAAQLASVHLQLSARPCAAAAEGDEAVASAPSATAMQAQWQFDVRPGPDLQPRQRQALLQALARSVAGWDDWQVVQDPVRGESASALTGGGAAGADAVAEAGWRWCLKPRTTEPAGASEEPGA